METERRYLKPGRRKTDLGTCLFHDDQCEQIRALWAKSERHPEKGDLKDLKNEEKDDIKSIRDDLGKKMDKSTFWKIIALMSILVPVLVGILSWILIESYNNNGRIILLIANQTKLMEHFKLIPIENTKNAAKILDDRRKYD